MIPLGKPKIDSLRIHLPLSEVIVNKAHSSFMRSITTSNEDGEILDEHVNTTYFNPKEIISCSYAVRRPFGVDTLYIGFSSKSLKQNYFNGIDKHTIKQCFNFINNEGLITISKEAFLNATAVDIDFCIDYHLDTSDSNIKDVINVCSELTIPNKHINVFTKREANNMGIWWGKRDKVGRAYKKKQFLKYYAKAIELKYNSTAFYEAYLKNELNSDLIDMDGVRIPQNQFFNDDKLLRVETTIKNNRHFDSYGYKVKSLRDLLNLELDKKFLQVFIRPMSQYMTGYKEIKQVEGMTKGQKWKYYAMMFHAKYYKCEVQEAIPYFVNVFHPNVKNHQSRSNFRTALYGIINHHQVGYKTKAHNNKIWNEFISEIEAKKIIPKKK